MVTHLSNNPPKCKIHFVSPIRSASTTLLQNFILFAQEMHGIKNVLIRKRFSWTESGACWFFIRNKKQIVRKKRHFTTSKAKTLTKFVCGEIMMRPLIVLVLLQFRISWIFSVLWKVLSALAANIFLFAFFSFFLLFFTANKNNSDVESFAAKSLLDRWRNLSLSLTRGY